MRTRALVALILLAIALRAIGLTSYSATDAEIAWLGSLTVPKTLEGQRIAALLFSALGIVVLARGLVRHGKPEWALVATLLLALDPLTIHASHSSVRSAVLGVAGAFWVRAMLATTRKSRIGEIASGIAFVALAITTRDPVVAPDPVFLAWSQLGALAIVGAFLHHAGYMLVPFALFAGGRERRLLLAAAVPLAACAAFDSIRLADLAGAMPAFVTLAAVGFEKARRHEVALGRPRFVVPALLTLILVSNAPVLLSDLLSGLRHPWTQASAWLALQRDLDPTTTRVFALDPEVAQRALGPRFTVERLPVAEQGIAAALDAKRSDIRERIVILPVSSGRLHGSARPELLAELETRKLADFAVTAKRFDLYRLELRIFRFR